MAKRQALQELQSRIAQLLQQAGSQPALAVSWLGVRLGDVRLLLPLQQSGQIYGVGTVLPLPYARPWFLGVTALRGNIHGVVDLASFIGFARPDSSAAMSERSSRRLVALNEVFGLNVTLLVDALEGLRGREDFEKSEPPPENAPTYYGSVFIDKFNYRWQELNLQALAQSPDFLNIAIEAAVAPAAQAHAK